MAKQYAKLWSGNFYAEVTSDYKSTKGKKTTKIRQKNAPRNYCCSHRSICLYILLSIYKKAEMNFIHNKEKNLPKQLLQDHQSDW